MSGNSWLVLIASLSFIMMIVMTVSVWLLCHRVSDNYVDARIDRRDIANRVKAIERIVNRINDRALKAARAEKKKLATEKVAAKEAAEKGMRPLEL